MKLKLIFIFTIIVTLFQNCHSGDKWNIPRKFYEHLAFYKPNDTLFFISSLNDIDTFLITRIDSGCTSVNVMPEEPHKYIRVKYHRLPVYRAKGAFSYQTDTSDVDMFQIEKYPNDTNIVLSFEFPPNGVRVGLINLIERENSLGETKSDTVISGLQIKNYYSIRNENPSSDTDAISVIFWTDKEGLMAYKQNNGIIWVRK